MNWDDILAEQEHLEHWGILGMKWGVRRYQNKDGSLTQAGRARYGSGSSKSLGERYSAYKKARTAKIKEKTMRSGDIKTILKNQKYLTDTEFDKAVARAKKVESLTPKEVKAIKEKKPESEYSKRIKDSIVDSLTRKRDKNVPSTQEARDYEIAKAKIEADKTISENKNQKVSGITFDKIQSGVKKAAKIYATYETAAGIINKVSGKKTLPTSLKDVLNMVNGGSNKGKSKNEPKKEPKPVREVHMEEVMNNLDRFKNEYGRVDPESFLNKVDINPQVLETSIQQLNKQVYSSGSTWGDINDLLKGW